MIRNRWLTALALFQLMTLSAGARAADVVVNGMALDPALVAQIAAAYRTEIVPGRYWYDPVAGLWGLEGGPVEGLRLAALVDLAPRGARGAEVEAAIGAPAREADPEGQGVVGPRHVRLRGAADRRARLRRPLQPHPVHAGPRPLRRGRGPGARPPGRLHDPPLDRR